MACSHRPGNERCRFGVNPVVGWFNRLSKARGHCTRGIAGAMPHRLRGQIRKGVPEPETRSLGKTSLAELELTVWKGKQTSIWN